MATTTQDVQANFETNLRDRLIAAQNGPPPQDPDAARQQDRAGPYPTNPRQPQVAESQIDPLIGGPDQEQHSSSPNYDVDGMAIDDSVEHMTNAQKAAAGRRELSTTKRAAQNRAAQRAFRQRKEAYITKLEKQVQDYRAMEDDYKALQHENYSLREHIVLLQNRILESSSELPQPPARTHLGIPPADHQRPPHLLDHHHNRAPIHISLPGNMPQPQTAPTASMTGQSQPSEDGLPQAAVEQLQAAAAEAGVLGDGNANVEQ